MHISCLTELSKELTLRKLSFELSFMLRLMYVFNGEFRVDCLMFDV